MQHSAHSDWDAQDFVGSSRKGRTRSDKLLPGPDGRICDAADMCALSCAAKGQEAASKRSSTADC